MLAYIWLWNTYLHNPGHSWLSWCSCLFVMCTKNNPSLPKNVVFPFAFFWLVVGIFRAFTPKRQCWEDVEVFKELHHYQGKVIDTSFTEAVLPLRFEGRQSNHFVFHQDFLKSYSANEFRMFCLLTKYRSGETIIKHPCEHWGVYFLKSKMNSSPQLLTTVIAAWRRLWALWEPSPPSSTMPRPTLRVNCSVRQCRKPSSGRGSKTLPGRRANWGNHICSCHVQILPSSLYRQIKGSQFRDGPDLGAHPPSTLYQQSERSSLFLLLIFSCRNNLVVFLQVGWNENQRGKGTGRRLWYPASHRCCDETGLSWKLPTSACHQGNSPCLTAWRYWVYCLYFH